MQPKLHFSYLPKSKKELAVEYEISTSTVKRWCIAIDINTRGKLTVKQVKSFYDHYGLPIKNIDVQA